MSEMIERVANVIYSTQKAMAPCACTGPLPICRCKQYLAYVAIATMREPTKAMCKAGAERHMVSNLEEEAKIKYQWMIDEALKKK